MIRIAGDDTTVVGSGATVDELADLDGRDDDGRRRARTVSRCVSPTPPPNLCAQPSTRDSPDHPAVADLVRYRVGPSIGAHTGPGTAGGFWYPARASWI